MESSLFVFIHELFQVDSWDTGVANDRQAKRGEKAVFATPVSHEDAVRLKKRIFT